MLLTSAATCASCDLANNNDDIQGNKTIVFSLNVFSEIIKVFFSMRLRKNLNIYILKINDKQYVVQIWIIDLILDNKNVCLIWKWFNSINNSSKLNTLEDEF